jgi:hypothetical protein
MTVALILMLKIHPFRKKEKRYVLRIVKNVNLPTHLEDTGTSPKFPVLVLLYL